MSKKTIIMVGKDIEALLMVLNPAVLGVVAPKAVTNFPKPSCSAKVL